MSRTWNKQKKLSEVSKMNSDILMQIAYRIETVIKGSNWMLLINLLVLFLNVYLVVYNFTNRDSALKISKQQHLELKEHTETLHAIQETLKSFENVHIKSDSLLLLDQTRYPKY